jgi:uncharacterized membrane protein YraQ (UPF0718 family)
MLFLVDLLLWAAVAALALTAAVRGKILLQQGGREGVLDFVRLIPRLLLGVIGSGFIAEALPQDVIGRWLGADSGVLGVTLAVIGGALTPGGPVVGFSIGSAALKGGAAAPQVIAYTTAWALFAVQRILVWELPIMSARMMWIRVAASLPVPFLAAFGAMLLGKP